MSFFRNLKLRVKLLTAGLMLTLIPVVIIGLFQYNQLQNAIERSREESLDLGYESLEHIASGVKELAITQHDLITKTLTGYSESISGLIAAKGGVSLSKADIVWQTFNVETQKREQVKLPKMMLGNKWFGQVSALNQYVPIVDEARSHFDAACSVFQRINDNGDMLRVATNVVSDGKRPLGTFMSRIKKDGSAHPVIETVMSGGSYRGRNYAIDGWFITNYSPIYDINKKIIGMLGVAVRQEQIKSLRDSIIDTVVGITGYVYVLDGEGHYVYSYKGQRDGEKIWDVQQDGKYIIRDIVRIAQDLKGDNMGTYSYMWKNPGDPRPRAKTAKLLYFEPWDWVIGASTYDEEFLSGVRAIEAEGIKGLYYSIAVIAGFIIMSFIVWIVISNAISRPILNITRAVTAVTKTKDLTHKIPMETGDEVGIMAIEFNNMLASLRQAFTLFDDASGHVNAQAVEVARRATANRDRAENEEKQIGVIQDTVHEMGQTAGEVQNTSSKQAESANTSYSNVEELIEVMSVVNQSSTLQIKEASVVTERVAAMGETATKVTNTARMQGEQVVQVTQSMHHIAESVKKMTEAANIASEQGRLVLTSAEEGSAMVDATVTGMQAIKDSSDQISDIIGVITDISEQTNLLALNAAIEAARAGVHGKGFAVVADEVGKLAQRSSEAAKEVTQLIKTSTSKVEQGTRLTDRSQEALQKIFQGGRNNMSAIEDISKSTDLLVSNTSEIGKLVEGLNKLASEIVGMAGQQGERREAAQNALFALVEKANGISGQVTQATDSAKSVGSEMRGVLERSENMKQMTDVQAGRSQRLRQMAGESAARAKQTASGAGEVVGITLEMQRLAANLTRQVSQFKIRRGSVPGTSIPRASIQPPALQEVEEVEASEVEIEPIAIN
ncbi:MAG: HAMP domain-containing protein [Desulfobacteraceae bacterium]|nr:HAMP domain-containing protein [Desulfobacteraceae bacterium]